MQDEQSNGFNMVIKFNRTTWFPSLVLAAMAMIAMGSTPAKATEAIWQKLRNGGYTLLIRHTRAPGTGDPANFELRDCSTQRNLSERGRLEARRRGARIAASGAIISHVYTSQWCRTKETAELAFERIRKVDELEDLNSFFRDPSTKEAQTASTLDLIENYGGPGNQAMVTHQVNITALTDIFPREGEAVVVQWDSASDDLSIIGRLRF